MFKINEKEKKEEIPKIIIINKKMGQTPLEVIKELKANDNRLEKVKMAYAGRLDPLAYGKMLILVGDECKQRHKYLSLDKEYIFEILLDFKSDSKDILGIPEYDEKSNFFNWENKKETFFKEEFNSGFQKKLKELYIKKMEMEYPIFSSKPVDKKPLFMWALEGKIHEIKIPTKEIEIYNINFESSKFIKKNDLYEQILKNINSIKKVTEKSKEMGKDFRRDEIRAKWKELFSKISDDKKFLVLKIKVWASSGTYMRTLAEDISQKILNSYGLAYTIERTKIGKILKKEEEIIFEEIK